MTNLDEHLIQTVQLARTNSIGPITFRRLVQKYKSIDAALDALPHLSPQKSLRVFARSDAIREIEQTLKLKGNMITMDDPRYPPLLKHIEDAPPVISVLGSVDSLQDRCVAIVGSRNSSLNARKFSYLLAQDLSKNDWCVVSGLARGIDTSAHEGALKQKTIAVIAGGVDVPYPSENEKLYHAIIDHGGAVISDAPLGMQPLAQHFPKRNRIITGLSHGVVVVEANARSGSLISARMAAEQGRAVMAVPGFPLDPRSSGTNDLIRNGATLVTAASDVLNEINDFKFDQDYLPGYENKVCESEDAFLDFPPPNPPRMDEIREILALNISISPISVDEILRACQLNSSEVQACLFEMELDGQIQRLPGNRICRIA